MNPSLSAPGFTDAVRAASALVIAPHFDDEVLGCGGLLTQLVSQGAVVRVLFLSDGSGGAEEVDDREAYRQRRFQEARRAAEVLGVAGLDRLDLPDGALDQHPEALLEGIRRSLLTFKPELLLVTSPLEASPDHRAAFHAVHRLLAGLRREHEAFTESLVVLAYEVNHPLYPNLLVDVSAELPRLEEAMACYTSQQERHDYFAARLGLLRFRALTLEPGVRAAEAYRRLRATDFTTRGPGRLVAELGGAPELLEVIEGPRISVIVRTRNRPELLAEALDSLAASTYRRAEVLVVNDGGEAPELPADHPLDLSRLDLETHEGRAAAANRGAAAATGDYVVFLDDDDLAEPEHLATLAGLVAGAGVRVAYTDAAVGVYRLDGDGEHGGWHCVERRLPYSRDFDADLLLFDNYIPFNTLVIDRRLFDEVGELDRELAFFEDWDFLIRLAAVTSFHHLERVTCEYRQFRGAGHHVLGDRPRERSDFLAMKARILERYAARRTPDVTARVIDLLRAEAVAEHEAGNRLRLELRRSAEGFHELNGRLRANEVHLQTLEESRARSLAELEQKRREHRQLDREHRQLDHEVDRLQTREQELESDVRRVAREADRLQARERELTGALESLQAEHGDSVERLRLMTEQEGRVAEELRRVYVELDRLDRTVRDMEATRAWRLHQWWQRHKP